MRSKTGVKDDKPSASKSSVSSILKKKITPNATPSASAEKLPYS